MTTAPTFQRRSAYLAKLGEGPAWDPARDCLAWVDILGHRLLLADRLSGATTAYPQGETVGFAALAADGRWYLGLAHRVVLFDPATGAAEVVLDGLEADRPRSRLNDGKAAPNGQLWFGSIDQTGGTAGAFYRFDPRTRELTNVRTGVGVSNGLGWSPDGHTLYYTDSPRRTIWAYPHDPVTGEVGEPRVFAALTARKSVPDGLAVDAEGAVWSAQWDGACLLRFAPDGALLAEVPTPMARPTSCAFVGPQLGTLLVTSYGGDGAEAPGDDLPPGALFSFVPGVPGLPVGAAALPG